MPTSRDRLNRDARSELQAWYVTSLRPKLARAATADIVSPAAAEELDRELCEFLELPPDGAAGAA